MPDLLLSTDELAAAIVQSIRLECEAGPWRGRAVCIACERMRAAVGLLMAMTALGPTVSGGAQFNHAPSNPKSAPTSAFSAIHDDAMRRARVWIEPEIPIAQANLGQNPSGPNAFAVTDEVRCRFRPQGVGGSTPKFDCELPSGEKVKVKYGPDNAEVYTEVAASRLLAALGFPTDQMSIVERVRCFGCPKNPYAAMQCFNAGAPPDGCLPDLDYSHFEDFDDAVIERSANDRRVETRKERGWGWNELNKIDPAAGGATRAQVDALRLMAVFLSHWDNKAENQRLVCLGEPDSSRAKNEASIDELKCDRPLAMVQDVGGTFGPFKLDVKGWSHAAVWANPAACGVSMRRLPYGGSSFPDARISEEGRAFLASRLTQLSTQQVRDLFEGARVAQFAHADGDARDVDNWVLAFENKVRAIATARCPRTN